MHNFSVWCIDLWTEKLEKVNQTIVHMVCARFEYWKHLLSSVFFFGLNLPTGIASSSYDQVVLLLFVTIVAITSHTKHHVKPMFYKMRWKTGLQFNYNNNKTHDVETIYSTNLFFNGLFHSLMSYNKVPCYWWHGNKNPIPCYLQYNMNKHSKCWNY